MNMGGNIDPDLNEKDVGRGQDVAHPKSVDKDVKILNNVSSNSNISQTFNQLLVNLDQRNLA